MVIRLRASGDETVFHDLKHCYNYAGVDTAHILSCCPSSYRKSNEVARKSECGDPDVRSDGLEETLDRESCIVQSSSDRQGQTHRLI